MPITSLLVNLLASPKKPKITPCLQDKTQAGGLVRRTIQVQSLKLPKRNQTGERETPFGAVPRKWLGPRFMLPPRTRRRGNAPKVQSATICFREVTRGRGSNKVGSGW